MGSCYCYLLYECDFVLLKLYIFLWEIFEQHIKLLFFILRSQIPSCHLSLVKLCEWAIPLKLLFPSMKFNSCRIYFVLCDLLIDERLWLLMFACVYVFCRQLQLSVLAVAALLIHQTYLVYLISWSTVSYSMQIYTTIVIFFKTGLFLE